MLFPWFFRCCTPTTKPDPSQDTDVKAKHLSCPRCRRVTGGSGGMQLCFSLSDQEAHGQGCGLPRELVERMPIVAVTEKMCANTKGKTAACGGAGKEEAKADPSEDGDSMTCRICLSDYKPGDRMRVLPCFHRFHVGEIDDWLNRNTTCPICHLDVNEALTGSSGVAFVNAVEGNPMPVIERRRA